jgi:hypothetical protein
VLRRDKKEAQEAADTLRDENERCVLAAADRAQGVCDS